MKFPAEHFEPADVIAMFVGEEHAIELPRRDPALLEPDHDLPRAEPAIDQNPAMIGRDQRAISRAAAAEHGQSEHASISSGRRRVSQIGNGNTQRKRVSSRGRRSAPRDLSSAQPLSRNVSRLRHDGVGSSLAYRILQLGGPSPSARLGMTTLWRGYSSNPAIFVCGSASTRAFFAP